eukprot:SAG31_NODE_1050_length_10160_cov_3.844648_5_plen_44_part_00
MYALSACYWLDKLPHAGDVSIICSLQPVAGLAADCSALGKGFP